MQKYLVSEEGTGKMSGNKAARGSLSDIITSFGEKVGVHEEERIWQHKPIDVIQFVEDPRYMDFKYKKAYGVGLRPCVADDLVAIFGMDPETIPPIMREAYFSEAVGTGKSTKLAFVCLYATYKLLCLYNPLFQLQKLGAKVGSNTKISIVMLSRTEENAKEVVFSKANAFVMQSEWFLENYLPAADITSKLVFDSFPKNRRKINLSKTYKNISIVPGSSSEFSPLGKDIYVGIMDEATKFQAAQDRKLTDADTDQAEVLYHSLTSRIITRFGANGLFVGMGNPEHKNDFLERHTEKVKDHPDIYIIKRRSYWDAVMPEFDPDVKNPDGSDKYPHFYFDKNKRRVIPDQFREKYENKPEILKIPYGPNDKFYEQFRDSPEEAMRDLAGIPTEAVGAAYTDPGLYARNAEKERENSMEDELQPNNPLIHIKSWFIREHLKWHGLHIDLGEKLDSATFALSHPYNLDERNNPYIWLDMIYRFQPSPQSEFLISLMQDFVEYLWKVKRIPIGKITADKHQSAQLLGTFRTWKIDAEFLSVDIKSKELYDNLVWTIKEKRLNYFTHDVWFREMRGLEKDGPNRIVKPPHGSDDVAQAVAGSVWNSMHLALNDDPEGERWDISNPWEEESSSAIII